MHIKANRLVNEKSPYLLQHSHNSVDWYPWRNEAFERAKVEDKPIFLSIGYSTCHWCHSGYYNHKKIIINDFILIVYYLEFDKGLEFLLV